MLLLLEDARANLFSLLVPRCADETLDLLLFDEAEIGVEVAER
jgi:hypothetical protein